MKKLLILGQLPKEHGGSYTTGVANVIIELSHFLKRDFETYIYATNLNIHKSPNLNGINALGYSYKNMVKLVFLELIKNPFGLIKQCFEFKKVYGVSPIKNLLYYIIIKDYIAIVQPDIINAHGIMFAPILKNLKKNNSVFYSFHGFMYDDRNSILANKKRGLDIKKLYSNSAKHINRAIYLTSEMKNKGEQDLLISTERSEIIPNGVNIDKFYFCKKSRKIIRNQFNIKSGEKVIISVGALTNRKNHIGFIEFLLRNNFKGHYWIIGKFEAEETKYRLLEYQKNEKDFKIEIINYIPHNDLYKFYSAADLYAHPSTSEGQALVVIEALCCGLPLIVNKNIRGTICVKNEYEDWISYVNLSKSSFPKMETNGRELLTKMSREDFNWSKAADSYKKIFIDAID